MATVAGDVPQTPAAGRTKMLLSLLPVFPQITGRTLLVEESGKQNLLASSPRGTEHWREAGRHQGMMGTVAAPVAQETVLRSPCQNRVVESGVGGGYPGKQGRNDM